MKKLIFVIDMLNGFTKKGNLASKRIKKLIPRISRHMQQNSEFDNIFFCDAHTESDLEMFSYPLHCLKNTPESEIVSELVGFAKTIIKKNTTNAFLKLENKEFLDSYNEFEIIGCCTDICILQFALNLKTYFNSKNMDKNVIVYKKLVNTFDSKNHKGNKFHKFALKLMENSGILIK
ncbi:isochorismatase family cysteine hydrolase [Metamycoplasma auris]|uniref:Nicotinamidase-related amidase n=1 Tax=Metamycoplasma auris TaxID=51363 RepID=A0A2W7GV03_9BACT|nr:isochorismatase family cysteine hydrolase [Metamycoplasma auris]PZW01523.1 nicotinamidase-related amidase [Metamycoplasma auris]